jgi:glucosamine-6-phosphate deaminase
VSVALDPEASGPDTHYKVLQSVSAAVEKHVEESKTPNLIVWGYRNVWFRFEPFEVSTIVPVSLQTISTLNHMFLSSFESQRDAEFPAYEIQGPFCAMSQKVQVEQYSMIQTCLGYQWFHKHSSPLIRATRGLVFLREMSVSKLLEESRALKRQTESA